MYVFAHQSKLLPGLTVKQGKVKLDAGDIEGGMKSIKPILQDVALCKSSRILLTSIVS